MGLWAGSERYYDLSVWNSIQKVRKIEYTTEFHFQICRIRWDRVMENHENTMKQIKMYEDIAISERQIKEGKVKDARKSLSSMRERYGI